MGRQDGFQESMLIFDNEVFDDYLTPDRLVQPTDT